MNSAASMKGCYFIYTPLIWIHVKLLSAVCVEVLSHEVLDAARHMQ